MQPEHEDSPFKTPLPADDRTSPSERSSVSVRRVTRTAEKIAGLLRELRRELETSEHTAAIETRGTLQVAVKTPASTTTIKLDDVSHVDRVCLSVTDPSPATNGQEPPIDGSGADPSTAITVEDDSTTSLHKRTRRDSDAELEKELVSRKRQRMDCGEKDANMQQDANDDDDIMPLITKEDLEKIVAKLREDIQEDTSECVNHVQKLLRRFKEEWHEKTTLDFERPSNGQNGQGSRPPAVGTGLTPAAAFPSPGAGQDDQDITVPELIRQESKLISSQIKWVEECRRVAADAHDQREENWRTSSANFHDKGRQERESFQGRILHEQGTQTQTLNQILSEVRSFGFGRHPALYQWAHLIIRDHQPSQRSRHRHLQEGEGDQEDMEGEDDN
ncbi:uncharacterized protein N0V89_009546 [Didymosphaeria variabile]|uniref:Uncharacterized protein n=1 Tax=Didymosphaeria variabile TaxID=1932322 RepID=A0A9W8XFC1_9PLEO|nr:uncharacterized protein N0V89_009546 [Didymosphaeria variabile]KAJ4348174.1 hypothetical protein N0V89_009546 [Didymosphaeria variabile]